MSVRLLSIFENPLIILKISISSAINDLIWNEETSGIGSSKSAASDTFKHSAKGSRSHKVLRAIFASVKCPEQQTGTVSCVEHFEHGKRHPLAWWQADKRSTRDELRDVGREGCVERVPSDESTNSANQFRSTIGALKIKSPTRRKRPILSRGANWIVY